MRFARVDALAAKAGAGLFDTTAFVELLAFCGMPLDLLYSEYVAQNTLSLFRGAHGGGNAYSRSLPETHLGFILSRLPAEEYLPLAASQELKRRYARIAA